MNKLEITTSCVCDLELGDCIDCFAEQFETIEDQFNAWRDSVDSWRGDGMVRVWETRTYGQRSTVSMVFHVEDFRELWDRVLSLRASDYRVEFERDGDSLTAVRYSHDESTGTQYEFTVVAPEFDGE